MRRNICVLGLAAAAVSAQSLDDVCTVEYVQSVLPAANFVLGIVPNAASVTANTVTNYTAQAGTGAIGGTGLDACNVTFSYTHTGLNDTVNVWYWLPAPDQYKSRWLSTGGGGLAINSGQPTTGIAYGAAAGATDGGFGGFNNNVAGVILAGNGTLNETMLVSFAYRAIHEMTVLGKQLTAQFYGNPDFFSYYAGCSEGGREGFSQVQRYSDQFDGVAVGAPAMRQAFQQPLHIFSTLVEVVEGYAPSSCELAQINTDLISACDVLDGRADGVVSRTDLCKLYYNVSSSIGNTYTCAASGGGGGPGGPGGGGGATTPALNGTISARGANIAAKLIRGIFDDEDRQAWIMFQPSAGFEDAATTYNNATGTFEPGLTGVATIGVQYINLFLREIDSSYLDIASMSYDDLRAIFLEGMQKFADTLQTTWPDLSGARDAGAKVLHWHGESDPSVPAGSSVIYQNSVRETMYPGLGFNESFDSLGDWYRLFLVPGAGHCAPSQMQPNGPFPADILGSLIEWVEGGTVPERLNATVQGGSEKGARQDLCSFPLRPLWVDNSTLSCVYDQASIDTWFPTLDSIPVPVY